MSHIVSEERVNQFLPTDKLDIPANQLHESYGGQELETTIWDIALAKLHEFEISSWTNASGQPMPNSVPKLVLDIIAMWVAGSIYNKQFSEESSDTGDTYGSKLRKEAMELLEGIAQNTLVVTGLVHSELGELNRPTTLETDPLFTMDTVY